VTMYIEIYTNELNLVLKMHL